MGQPVPIPNGERTMNDTITNRYSVSIRPPQVGQKVRVYSTTHPEGYEGSVGTVTAVGSISGWAECQSPQKPDDTESVRFDAYEEIMDTDIIEPKMIPLSDHDREVEALRNRIRNLERELATGKETHADLGRRLLNQAENRGWCSEFDEFVSDYNGDCPVGWEIDERVKLVQKRVRVEGTVYRDITVWVKEDDDETDPDNWYADNDTDTAVDSDYVTEQLDSEYEGNGWDDTNIRSL